MSCTAITSSRLTAAVALFLVCKPSEWLGPVLPGEYLVARAGTRIRESSWYFRLTVFAASYTCRRAAAAAKSIESRGLNRYRRARDQQLQRKRARRNRKSAEFLGCCRSHFSNRVAYWCQDIRDSNIFQAFIISVIFGAALLVGIQTYDLSGDLAITVEYADDAVLWIFVGELVVKFAGEGRFPWRFFNSLWNVFDFVIVVVGFVPFSGGQAVMALRLVRLLRVLKLVRALPKLRVLVIGLLKSLSSIVYIGALLLLLFYLYAVVGVSVYGKADPVNMGTLHSALITLFRASTLEDWTDLLYTHQFGCDVFGYEAFEFRCTDPQAFGVTAIVFWVSFIVMSSMIILNLWVLPASQTREETDRGEIQK